jgi:hypothetical protein
MRRAAPLLALLALSTVLVSPVAAATDSPADPALSQSPAVTAPDASPIRARLSSPANTTIEIAVQPNRSARWRVTFTYALDTANETAAFREYAEAYRNGETTVGPSADLFRTIVDEASAATDRRMAVRHVSRDARVGESTGSVTLSFVWTRMLERTGNRTIRLGDAVALPANRTWIGTLETDQTLIIRTPERYSVVDSGFELRNNTVVVSGPARIGGNLQITYRRTATPEQDDTPWALVAGAVLVVTIVVGSGIYVRRSGRRPRPSEAGPTAAPEVDEDGGAGSGPGDGEPPAEREESTAGAAADTELLSDEERVERLLRANDGRMKQAAIVDETGWSDAKVSQLLSAMSDEGRIEKLRLGRENLISLPDEDDEGSGTE